MRMRNGVVWAAVAAAGVAMSGCGSGGTGTSGGAPGAGVASGATFPAIAYTGWCKAAGVCSYTPKGSSAGIADFTNALVDWAGSDAPLNDQQRTDLASKRGGAAPVYFPTLLGAVSVPVNLSGATGIRLDGPTLGRIFAGDITRWNDPALTALNAGMRLPSTPITVCVRADGSGTSFNFSSFLQKTSPVFASRVGAASQQPNWSAPRVVRQPGNPGVAQCVKDNRASIGYLDLGDAKQAGLVDSLARVKSGSRFVAPTVAAISAAGNVRVQAPIDPVRLQGALLNSSAAGAYPITITTFVLGYSDYAKAGRAASLPKARRFLEYAYSATAQHALIANGFAPLPQNLIAVAKRQLAGLR